MPLRHNNKGTSSCHALTGVWGKLYANTSSNRGYKDQVFLKTISLRFTKRTCVRAARWQYYALLAITFFDLCRSATTDAQEPDEKTCGAGAGAGTGKQPPEKIKSTVMTYHEVYDSLFTGSLPDDWVECESRRTATTYYENTKTGWKQWDHPKSDENFLGGGTYGRVFNLGDGRCVKFICLREGQYDDLRVILREAEIMVKLNHPNIMGITSTDILIPTRTDPKTNLLTDMKRFRKDGAGLVMEKMSGSLYDLMNTKGLSEAALDRALWRGGTSNGVLKRETIIKLTYQLLRGAAYLHSENIMHRDYKPENIMLKIDDKGGLELKIGDFGWSRYHDKDNPEELSIGPISPHYRPLEVFEKRYYGLNCDVWSVGLIILEMLANAGEYKSFLLDNVKLEHNTEDFDWDEEIRKVIENDLQGLDREGRKKFIDEWIQQQNTRTKTYDIYDELLNIVTGMLEVRDTDRPDMKKFEEQFNKTFEKDLRQLGLSCHVEKKSKPETDLWKMDKMINGIKKRCKEDYINQRDLHKILKPEDLEQLFSKDEHDLCQASLCRSEVFDESADERMKSLKRLIWDTTALYIGLHYLKEENKSDVAKKRARRTNTARRLDTSEQASKTGTGSSGKSHSGCPSAPPKHASTEAPPAHTADSNDATSTHQTADTSDTGCCSWFLKWLCY